METFGIDLNGKVVNLEQLHWEVAPLAVGGVFRGLNRTGHPTTIEVWTEAPLSSQAQLNIVSAVDSHKPQPEDGWTAAEFAQAGIPMPAVWPPVRPGA